MSINRNRQYLTPTNIGINAKVTTGDGNTINVTDFRNATYSLGTSGNADMTVKVKVGLGDTAPNFASAASETNRWIYADIAPLNNSGVIIDGDVGIVFTGVDGVHIFEVNTNGVDYIALSITARAAGSVTADLTLTTNG